MNEPRENRMRGNRDYQVDRQIISQRDTHVDSQRDGQGDGQTDTEVDNQIDYTPERQSDRGRPLQTSSEINMNRDESADGKDGGTGENLSQNQKRARLQHRHHGRFVPDPARPGMSASTNERAIRHERQRRKSTCRQNVWRIVSAVLKEGERGDFVPSSADGPLTKIVDMILLPQFRVPSRMVPAIARDVYLQKSHRHSVPRRNIRKHGAVVKKRVAVFAGMRLPCTDTPVSLISLRSLLTQLHDDGMLRSNSVEECIQQLFPVFDSYDADTHEYDGYPIISEDHAHSSEDDDSQRSQPTVFDDSIDTPLTAGTMTAGSDRTDRTDAHGGEDDENQRPSSSR